MFLSIINNAMDVEEGARIVVKTCLGVQRDEEVLIITDDIQHDVANTFFMAALEMHAHPLLVKTHVAYEGQEPTGSLAELMKFMDVIIIITKHSLSHTKARRDANRAGARIASMPNLKMESLVDGGLTADYNEIEMLMRRVYRRIRGGKNIFVTSGIGTNLSFNISGRKWVIDDTGICSRKGGFTTLPAGEIFVAPLEGSGEGKLVVDGSFMGLMDKSATVTIREGVVVKIADAQRAIREMNRSGREGRILAKFGIGLNPKASITGNILEDEKKLGTINIGFGGNYSFGGQIRSEALVSAVINEPTVMVDDITLIDKGRLNA
jgi:leucyl aminopeptidase (aminopeptidase T)